jgi:ATP-binding cassette, subfamily C, bacterial CydC
MTAPTGLLRPTRQTIIGALLGGAATASGIALTATSGWLIVRASEEPIILTLMVAIVAVRTFGIARPFFRYLERLVSHDAALDDLARRRTSVYAALIPLTPARLGRRSRSRVLTGVVDDLTDVVEAQVRVTVPLLSSALAALVAVLLTAWFSPAVGLVLAGLMVAVAGTCWVAWLLESHSRDELLESRAEVLRVSDLVARQAAELQAIGATETAAGWLDDAHDTLRRAVRRQSRGRALVAAALLVATALATLLAALLVDPAVTGRAVAALLVVVPVALGDALVPLVDTMRHLARAEGSAVRLEALLDQEPAVTDSAAALADGIQSSGRRVDLDGVAASWTGHGEQLEPTDLHLAPGQRVAVVGPNGTGKSTLLAVLARQLDPSRGRHAVDNVDVHHLTIDDVRRHVAVVDDGPGSAAGWPNSPTASTRRSAAVAAACPAASGPGSAWPAPCWPSARWCSSTNRLHTSTTPPPQRCWTTYSRPRTAAASSWSATDSRPSAGSTRSSTSARVTRPRHHRRSKPCHTRPPRPVSATSSAWSWSTSGRPPRWGVRRSRAPPCARCTTASRASARSRTPP